MGGGDVPETQTQISKVILPEWVNTAGQENYAFAQQVANKPLVQYGGQTVADVSPATAQAWLTMQNGQNAGDQAYGNAAAGYKDVANNPIVAGALANTDLSPYMNPYTQAVTNNALRDLEGQRVNAINTNADKAVAAKAFGGSRGAIVDALTNSEAIKKAGDLSASQYQANFNQAQQAATGDINRNLTAAQSNATNMLGAAQGMNALGDSQVKALVQKYMGLTDAGNQQNAQQQKELDAQKAIFDEANNYDLNRLNILLSSLGMSPYGKTQETTTTQSGGGGTDWAQAGLGALSIFGSLFSSDRRDKTDIKKLGKDPITGLDMFAYRYKGDPKSYPKVVGPMAQDIEKAFPGSTVQFGGHMVVNAGKGALAHG